MIVPPAFVDDGHDGTWAEALLHSPFLKVSDYAPCQLTEPDRAAQSLDTEYRPRAPFTPTLASGGNGHPPAGTSDGGTTGCDISLRMDGTGEQPPLEY